MFTNAETVMIHGKEVQSIITADGGVLYDMDNYNPYLILGFTGSQFSINNMSQGLSGNNIVIDWGDGTTTNYSSVSDLNHTYNETGDYTITITGVTRLGDGCFSYCSGLTSVILPDTLTSLGNYCFQDCSGLISIVLNWDNANDIITYTNRNYYESNNVQFIIPYGTTSLYTAKGYPASKLEEANPAGLNICSSESIIFDEETTEIYAQIVDNNGDPYSFDNSGKTVYFFEEINPNITLSSDKNTIEAGETVDIYAQVRDSNDGSIVKNTKVYFYEEVNE